jgi:hypothetical protein
LAVTLAAFATNQPHDTHSRHNTDKKSDENHKRLCIPRNPMRFKFAAQSARSMTGGGGGGGGGGRGGGGVGEKVEDGVVEAGLKGALCLQKSVVRACCLFKRFCAWLFFAVCRNVRL